MIDFAGKVSVEESSNLNGLAEAEIRAELDRILRSRAFIHSRRIRRFLQFVVEECLLEKHHRLKEYLIGLEVFNRQEAFDPRVDSIVRVEARRLRSKLDEYYASEGQESIIRIQLRKGSYVPVFERRGTGFSSRPGFAPAAPRRAIGIGEITVFNGGGSHETAVEDVKRRVAHVLIKEGLFQVNDVAEAAVDALPDSIVVGSLHFHAEHVNLILQLRNRSNSSYAWSEQVDCKLDDLSAAGELARSLNRYLTTVLTGDGARVRRNGADRGSYDFYLQGRYNWKIGTPESIRDSIPMFTKAIEQDSDYAAAWAALSQALQISSLFGFVQREDAADRMKDAAERSLSLKENLPEGHLAEGGVLSLVDGNWEGGEREILRAIQLDPTDSMGHLVYGLHLACRRRLDAAVHEVETALEIDPASLATNFALGWLFTVCGRYDDSLAQHRVVAQLAPDFPLSYLGMGWAHAGKQKFRDAVASFTNASSLLKAHTLLAGCLGYCYARLGDRDEALRQLLSVERAGGDRLSAAAIYAGLGDSQRALDYLEEAVTGGSMQAALRTLNPEFDGLRGEARFSELMERLGVGPRAVHA